MQAGRELDALIAEKVMGWQAQHRSDMCDGSKFIRCSACGALGRGNCYGDGQGQMQIRCGEVVTCCDEAALPNYSTDIATAWCIIEKLTTDNPYWCIDVRQSLKPRGWWCNIGVPDSWIKQWAETAPLAICLAALKAMGVTYPTDIIVTP